MTIQQLDEIITPVFSAAFDGSIELVVREFCDFVYSRNPFSVTNYALWWEALDEKQLKSLLDQFAQFYFSKSLP